MPIPSQEIIDFLEDARQLADRVVIMCNGALDLIEGRTVRVDAGPMPEGAELEIRTAFAAPVTEGPVQCQAKGCGTILTDGKCPRCGWTVESTFTGAHSIPSPTQCQRVGCGVQLIGEFCPRCEPQEIVASA